MASFTRNVRVNERGTRESFISGRMIRYNERGL